MAENKRASLVESINWDAVMEQPRYAGGHDEIMLSVFDGAAEVIAHYNSGGYDGDVATAWKFPCGTVAIITDYYGSCSGCDAYEDASDEDLRRLVSNMVGSARIFDTPEDAAKFCDSGDIEYGEDYPFAAAAWLRDGGSWVSSSRDAPP